MYKVMVAVLAVVLASPTNAQDTPASLPGSDNHGEGHFGSFDWDGSGGLNNAELGNWGRSHGYNDWESSHIFQRSEENEDGEVTYEEYMDHLPTT